MWAVGLGVTDTDGGTDTLLVDLAAPAAVEVGALGAVAGFGCSDCRCVTHLAGAPARRPLVTAVTRAHRRAQEG